MKPRSAAPPYSEWKAYEPVAFVAFYVGHTLVLCNEVQYTDATVVALHYQSEASEPQSKV